MNCNYIVKDKNGRLLSLYYIKKNAEKGIYLRIFEKGEWSRQYLIANGVREYYTVNMAENGEIYLFCQSENGDIILCKEQNYEWQKNVILKSKDKSVKPIFFNSIINGNEMRLIYNVPVNSENADYLMVQGFDGKGGWLEAEKIDKISSFSSSMFNIQKAGSGHYIVFYQKRTNELNVGYRELTTNKTSDFNAFHNTKYQLIDQSFLVASDSIHFLYIVRGMFSSQIIYRKKDGPDFSNIIIIAEGQKIDNCCLSIIDNKIYAYWIYNSQLYFTVSDDNGKSFAKPSRYRRKFCAAPVKCQYLSYESMSESRFCIREVYSDSGKPWDIQIIPDLCGGFFLIESMSSEAKEKPFSIPHEQEDNEYSEKILKLKNQLDMCRIQLEQKDKQILKINTALEKKNEELVLSDASWRERYKALLEENRTLKEKIDLKLDDTTEENSGGDIVEEN